MADVRVSPRANADLEEIWLTVALDNQPAADRLLRGIGTKLELLAVFPEMGARRPDIAPSARLLVEGSYLVLYEIGPEGVEVVRVIHGARDLDNVL